jgi:hypothetical protein
MEQQRPHENAQHIISLSAPHTTIRTHIASLDVGPFSRFALENFNAAFIREVLRSNYFAYLLLVADCSRFISRADTGVAARYA